MDGFEFFFVPMVLFLVIWSFTAARKFNQLELS